MKLKAALITIFFMIGCGSFAGAEKLNEIKRYFELRDTLSLVNLEMKRALAPDSRSPMLTEKDAEQTLTRLVLFLEDRVKDFAGNNTALKQHYTRNLNNLLNESRFLFSNVILKIRSKPLTQPPLAAAQAAPASLPAQLQDRPYFHPIDLRTLLSPALLNANDLKKAESVWANRAQVSSATATGKLPASETVAAPAVDSKPEVRKVKSEIIGKTPVVTGPKPAVKTEPAQKSVDKPAVKPEPAQKSFDKPVVKPESAQKPADKPVDKPVISTDTASIEVISSGPASVKTPVQEEPAGKAEVASVTTVVTATSAVQLASGATALRPLAVMIENHIKARPQSGLINAEVVYEMPVEGGITRFMALYFHVPGLIGPVRSCREYYVDRALEVDALYVHCGGSPKGYAYLSSSRINSIDEIKHGKPFFRDKTRKAPHNLYTRGAGLVDYLSSSVAMKLPKKPVPFNYGAVPSKGQLPGKELYIRYHGNYNASYKYNNGFYERYMNGSRHNDRESDRIIAPKTVILQTASMKTIDAAGRQEISFVGSGSAVIFYAGTLIQATWHKKNAAAMTDYLDGDGRKVIFDQSSPIWVQVVSPNLQVLINGEDPGAEKEKNEKKAEEPQQETEKSAVTSTEKS